MPRIGVILELSREHHAALLLARDALQLPEAVEAATVVAMNARIAALWRNGLEAHFAREEALLEAWPDVLPVEHAERLLVDHADLRAACLQAGMGGLDARALRAFGRRMFDHVRFEERLCFPPMQHAIHGR